MNNLSDTLQIFLTWPASRWFACVICAVCLFQALRVASAALDVSRFILSHYVVPVWRLTWWIKPALVGSIIFLFSAQVHDLLQELECRYWNPVYLDAGAVSDAERITVYESEIRKYCDSYEASIVRDRTAQTAAKINSTPAAIYEAALLECGLNPFRVRADGVAAGWIQFTRAGLLGLGVSLDEVKAACRRRDAAFVMELTEKYLVRRWEIAGRPDMRNTIDLYLAIFAPAHISAAPEKVVYAGFGNPAYELNSGLDGWYQDHGKIIRKQSMRDGRITVWEIFLCLERRKGLLLRRMK